VNLCLRSSFRFRIQISFGNTKVNESDVAVRVKKDVLRFQISVHDTACVHVLQSNNKFGRVKSNPLVGKTALISQHSEHLAAINVLSHQEVVTRRLKRKQKRHDERMVRPCKTLSLCFHTTEFICFHYQILSNYFH
jgi:hypothetical protein